MGVAGRSVVTPGHYSPRAYSPLTGRKPPRCNPASWVYANHHNAATHQQSANIVAELILSCTAYPLTTNVKGTVAMNQSSYAFTYYQATSATPRYTLTTIDPYAQYRTDNFTGPQILVNVPIPPGAVGSDGTDGACIIHDVEADVVWEFWKFKDLGGGAYECYQGGRVHNYSQSYGVHKYNYGVSASGLMLAPLMVTADDVARGRIDHAMYLGVSLAYLTGAHAAPANRHDGANGNRGSYLKEGHRFVLPPTVDLAGRGLSPMGYMIADAMRRGYPLVVCDRTSWDGGGGISLESTTSLGAQWGIASTVYSDRFGGKPTYDQLGDPEFPWDQVRCVDESFMVPAGWPNYTSVQA